MKINISTNIKWDILDKIANFLTINYSKKYYLYQIR